MTHEDEDNGAVLRAFGLPSGSAALVGRGGEATTYALGTDRVLRVLHAGTGTDKIYRSWELLKDLTPSAVPFRLPDILQVGQVAGRAFAIERRLPGLSLEQLLTTITGSERDRLIESHLEAALLLGDLRPEPWDFYGELAAALPVRAKSWRKFLSARAAKSLAEGGYPFGNVDTDALASDLPEPERISFVHLDAFAGNMLSDGIKITAVLDFGPTCIAGDRRFDPLATAAYLEPEHFSVATTRDQQVARSWLRSAGVLDMLEPVRRWLAAYWAFAVDEARLQEWCRSILS